MHLSHDAPDSWRIYVGSRCSALAKAQMKEALAEISRFHPQVEFIPVYIETYGDKDRSTSLRTMGKTDFFTREIDLLQLSGGCRISIHSAKDLPEPLKTGLKLVALTKGIDASDSLVLRDGDTLAKLPSGAVIATSCFRREEAVKKLRHDLRFVDVRGVIEERLLKLINREVDGIVVAEAALVRLELTHLNRIRLPGNTAPLQGQLAIIAREEDVEMAALFASIDARRS